MTWTATTGSGRGLRAVLYKLKELGKISQEEIAEFLEEFDQLDADNSGTLSPHDLIVAQPG